MTSTLLCNHVVQAPDFEVPLAQKICTTSRMRQSYQQCLSTKQ
jgi:hypothetical protein